MHQILAMCFHFDLFDSGVVSVINYRFVFISRPSFHTMIYPNALILLQLRNIFKEIFSRCDGVAVLNIYFCRLKSDLSELITS